MDDIDAQTVVLADFDAALTFQDLEKHLDVSSDNPEIIETAQRALNTVKKIVCPRAVYQWVEFECTGNGESGCIIHRSGDSVTFDFGYSLQFLTEARRALISVYTTGRVLENELKHASSKGDLLEAYFLDLIGLIALEKLGEKIKGIAEEQARKLGWGVSPFLSPGSVHGWDLKEQVKLCSLLPLEKIDVSLHHDTTLSPLKTVSCLIGLGPGYRTVHVGTTCQVCSKKEACLMKQNQT